ncbi:MAG: integrase arm-type DNA-binding domain-containing protein [Pseudomonadales bacterium]|nr:integrase arm-type DNA-binding domain-containing protein [Pseudomonadales bacterium]
MLTDTAIRKAKPGEKPVKMTDEKGLFLLLTPAGGKLWRLKYRYMGKEKLLALGAYPDVSLAEAREKRDAARKMLANEIDPGAHRKITRTMKAEQAANSFEAVAREWFAKYAPTWAAGHADKIIRRLERDLFPWIGGRPIAEVTAPELLAVLRRIEERGAVETAHRAKQNAGQVFRYAIATGRAERDPSVDLRGALTPWKPQHYPAITDPKEIAPLLRAIDGFTGTLPVKTALKLAPLLLVRPGELRQAEWAEIDLEAATWNIPGEKMKTRAHHLVPLPVQALKALLELQPLTGRSRFVFPGVRDHAHPMSENTVNMALRRMGYPKEVMTGHGFRAMARTVLDEVLGYPPHIIEQQLAHAVRDPLGRAYNRTAHLQQRREMLQAWADYLDKLKAGAEVIPFPGRAA